MADGDDALWRRLAVPPGPPVQPDARSADDNDLWTRLTTPPPAPLAATPAANAEPVGRGGSFAMGAVDPLYGGAQLMSRTFPGVAQNRVIQGLGRMLGMGEPRTAEQIDATVRASEATYQAGRAAAGRTGTDWWRMGGNMVSGAPLAAVAAPAGLPAAVGAGVLTGAAQGALQPVAEGNPADFWGAKTDQAVSGAVGGAIGAGVGNAVGRLLSPRVRPEVRTLADANVRMTPGQILGGAAQTVEDKAISLPIVGDMIRAGRAQSVEDLNRAAGQRVAANVGQQLPADQPIGREMIGTLQQMQGQAYDAATAQLGVMRPDPQFRTDILNNIMRLDTPAQRQAAQAAFQNHLMPMLRNGEITPDVYKQIDSSLGAMARDLASSPDALQRHTAPAYRALQEAIRGMTDRQYPQAGALFRRADQMAADMMVLERAAASGAAFQDGIPGAFSPAQLAAASKAQDGTIRDRATAAGRGRMQDLSDAGRAVLPSQIPNSGTTDRAAMAVLMSEAAQGRIHPAFVAGGVAASLPYTGLGQRMTQGLLAGPRTGFVGRPIGLLGDVVAPSGGAVAVPLGSLLLGPPEPRPEQRR